MLSLFVTACPSGGDGEDTSGIPPIEPVLDNPYAFLIADDPLITSSQAMDACKTYEGKAPVRAEGKRSPPFAIFDCILGRRWMATMTTRGFAFDYKIAKDRLTVVFKAPLTLGKDIAGHSTEIAKMRLRMDGETVKVAYKPSRDPLKIHPRLQNWADVLLQAPETEDGSKPDHPRLAEWSSAGWAYATLAIAGQKKALDLMLDPENGNPWSSQQAWESARWAVRLNQAEAPRGGLWFESYGKWIP